MRLSFKKITPFLLILSVLGFVSAAPMPSHAQGKTDPLAQWRKSSSDAAKDSSASGDIPAPTMGGYQQPTDGAAPQQSLDQMDEEALMKLQARQKEIEQLTRDAAFESALMSLMPMSPEEISKLLDAFRTSREAAEQRVGGDPKPIVTVETVSLDPSATPPVLKVSPGYVTSLNIMDITGKPWPIETLSWGGELEVVSPGDGGHIVRISPMKAHAVGNLSVKLLSLDTPVTFSIKSALEEVHYRFDARIPEYGPYADMPIIDTGVTIKAGGSPSISTILQGVIPSGATRLKVEGVDGRTTAYKYDGQTMVRTPLTLLSPGWSESAKSADGMTVYVIHNTPVLLLSDSGKMMRATLSESEVQ